jgi:hypothetical protein
VQRILRRNWADLARLATPCSTMTPGEWNSLMVDRAALLAPRLAQLPARPDEAPTAPSMAPISAASDGCARCASGST